MNGQLIGQVSQLYWGCEPKPVKQTKIPAPVLNLENWSTVIINK